MIPDMYKLFINKILEKTNRGEAKWEKSKSKAYVLRTENSTIEIGYYVNDDAELSYYFFNYRSLQGNKEAGFRVHHLENDYQIMEDLFTVAQASATSIEDELTSFLNDLK